MAGAVPQQRGGSNTSTVVMVISIVVAVLLLGALIWLITMQEQLRTTAEKANSDRTSISKKNDELNKTVGTLCRSLGGSDKDASQTAIKKFDDALAKIAADEKVANKDQLTAPFGAAAIVENIHKLYEDERSGRESAESEREKAVKQAKSAQDQLATVQKKFGDEVSALAKKVDDLQVAKADFEKLKTADIDSLKSQMNAKQDAMESIRKEAVEMGNHLKAEINQRERLLDEQKVALANLRGPAAVGAQELALARKPIGEVLRALPGDSLVHISLGKDANVTLGMTFTVYSSDERIPMDGRGKAAVEVVGLSQRTAECRVTSLAPPDDPILEGDRVGNIILSREKGKKPHFCIVGNFDIDFDGNVDARGAMAVAALVKRWGGEVVDTVDAETDYLVMGAEPAYTAVKSPVADKPADKPKEEAPAEAEAATDEKAEGEAEKPAEEGADEAKTEEAKEEKPAEEKAEAPKIEKKQETDLTAEPRIRTAATEREKYDDAVLRAEKFAIPRLPADRFYNFVGLEMGPRAARAFEN
ncbi:MAG: hypothetical protein AABZ08_07440 [Planctomycetota bacterium]